MRFLSLLSLLVLITIGLAQDEDPLGDPGPIIITDQKPIIPDPPIMQQANQVLFSVVRSGTWGNQDRDFTWFNMEQERMAMDFHNMTLNMTGGFVA
jgi:hypothetical protein